MIIKFKGQAITALILSFLILPIFSSSNVKANPQWAYAWPNTDFTRSSVDFSEILSGGPSKDGIPPIDEPTFIHASNNTTIDAKEPVIGLTLNGEEKAYPLRILMWHEIVNDTVGSIPVAITFCPLCNAAIVFDRRVEGKILTFGTTGKLRHSDLIMWDRQTESWWQQFTGAAIVGEMMGSLLPIVPSRLESFENFLKRTGPTAQLLVPNDKNMRRYGANPYEGYDNGYPFLYKGDLPKDIKPLERVVSLSDKSEAWSLKYLKSAGHIKTKDGTRIEWSKGQSSALDQPWIADGKDVGNVIATNDGKDVVYFVDFAFSFYAFHPTAPIHQAP